MLLLSLFCADQICVAFLPANGSEEHNGVQASTPENPGAQALLDGNRRPDELLIEPRKCWAQADYPPRGSIARPAPFPCAASNGGGVWWLRRMRCLRRGWRHEWPWQLRRRGHEASRCAHGFQYGDADCDFQKLGNPASGKNALSSPEPRDRIMPSAHQDARCPGAGRRPMTGRMVSTAVSVTAGHVRGCIHMVIPTMKNIAGM